jgi:hypothetical protein
MTRHANARRIHLPHGLPKARQIDQAARHPVWSAGHAVHVQLRVVHGSSATDESPYRSGGQHLQLTRGWAAATHWPAKAQRFRAAPPPALPRFPRRSPVGLSPEERPRATTTNANRGFIRDAVSGDVKLWSLRGLRVIGRWGSGFPPCQVGWEANPRRCPALLGGHLRHVQSGAQPPGHPPSGPRTAKGVTQRISVRRAHALLGATRSCSRLQGYSGVCRPAAFARCIARPLILDVLGENPHDELTPARDPQLPVQPPDMRVGSVHRDLKLPRNRLLSFIVEDVLQDLKLTR